MTQRFFFDSMEVECCNGVVQLLGQLVMKGYGQCRSEAAVEFVMSGGRVEGPAFIYYNIICTWTGFRGFVKEAGSEI